MYDAEVLDMIGSEVIEGISVFERLGPSEEERG